MTTTAQRTAVKAKEQLEAAMNGPAVTVAAVVALAFAGGIGMAAPQQDPLPTTARPQPLHHAAQPEMTTGSRLPTPLAANYPIGTEAMKPPAQPPITRATEPKPAVTLRPLDPGPEEKTHVKEGPVMTTGPTTFSPLEHRSEEQLRALLQDDVTEVDLDTVKGTVGKLTNEAEMRRRQYELDHFFDEKPKEFVGPPAPIPFVQDVVAQRPDLAGLPLGDGPPCEADKETARAMAIMSRAWHSSRAMFGDLQPSRAQQDLASRRGLMQQTNQIIKLIGSVRGAKDERCMSTLIQLVQAENSGVRLGLVKYLAERPSLQATEALARLAVFDLAPEVRQAAVNAVRDRSGDDVRPILLEGLRYPWAPIADHAAEALTALDDRAAVPALVGLLYAPDPQAPTLNADQKWVVPQLVRVNHLRNCLLCHAPSFDARDLLRASVPTPGKALPSVYSASSRGSFVRADVTYLHQDFSDVQFVDDHGTWPEFQRYDYLIRTRELTPDEVAKQEKTKADASMPRPYRQRDAVLFALRNLAGIDLGESADAWFRFLVENRTALQP